MNVTKELYSDFAFMQKNELMILDDFYVKYSGEMYLVIESITCDKVRNYLEDKIADYLPSCIVDYVDFDSYIEDVENDRTDSLLNTMETKFLKLLSDYKYYSDSDKYYIRKVNPSNAEDLSDLVQFIKDRNFETKNCL